MIQIIKGRIVACEILENFSSKSIQPVRFGGLAVINLCVHVWEQLKSNLYKDNI